MTTAAHSTTVKIGGTSTAFSTEACTEVTANTVYRITDATKQVWDPTAALTVEVDPLADGNWAAAGTHTVDWLRGKVTFAADQGGPALVRVSGFYIPLLAVATAREYAFDLAVGLPDTTTFGSAGERERIAALGDLSGSLGLVEDLATDHDTGGGTRTFSALVLAKTKAFLEIKGGGVAQNVRAWVLFDSGGIDGALDDAIVSRIAWKAAGNGTTTKAASYSYSPTA